MTKQKSNGPVYREKYTKGEIPSLDRYCLISSAKKAEKLAEKSLTKNSAKGGQNGKGRAVHQGINNTPGIINGPALTIYPPKAGKGQSGEMGVGGKMV